MYDGPVSSGKCITGRGKGQESVWGRAFLFAHKQCTMNKRPGRGDI